MTAYLADEVECYHVTGLSGDRGGCELELVVCCDGHHHGGCRSSQALRKSSINDISEQHFDSV